MEPDNFTVTRSLPVDAGLLDDVVRRLRRDAPVGVLRWNLGDRGSVEIDAGFVSDGQGFRTTGRIWNPPGMALASVTLTLAPSEPDTIRLTVEPAPSLPRWWQQRPDALEAITHAVVDELGEELLWHAMRAGVSSSSAT